jgi:DNA-binding MarR family transcriptional regulator
MQRLHTDGFEHNDSEVIMGEWTLFSNHGHVLVCLARDKEARLRNVADDVGITERAVQKIVGELQEAGFITITKHGRCNRYEINTRKTLRHALEAKCTVGRLLQLFTRAEKPPARPAAEPSEPAHTPPAAGEHVVQGQMTDAAAAPPEMPPVAAPAMQAEASGKERKARAHKEPPDTRQQGSLF